MMLNYQGLPLCILLGLAAAVVARVVTRGAAAPSQASDSTGPAERSSSDEANTGCQDDSWDVFLSHSGDEKKTSVSHLQSRLESRNLRVFVDWQSLELGDDAAKRMVAAAKNALVGVAVLTPEYFKRKWPRKELEIVAARGTLLPLFYKVTFEQFKELIRSTDLPPSLAKNVCTGHEYFPDGPPSHNEAAYFDCAARAIWQQVEHKRRAFISGTLIGRDLDAIKRQVLDSDAQVHCILGMGGLGKSTLARALMAHDDIRDQFGDMRCFLEVNDIQVGTEAVRLCLGRLLSDLGQPELPLKGDMPTRINRLRFELARLARKRRVFIVLDNVWRAEVANQLLVCMAPGSKVIVTARERRVWKGVARIPQDQPSLDGRSCLPMDEQAEPAEEIPLDFLVEHDAIQLMRYSAFGSQERPQRLLEEVNNVLEAVARKCGGLPLLLSVVGALAKSRIEDRWSMAYWQRLLRQLPNIAQAGAAEAGVLDTEVLEVLEISVMRLTVVARDAFLSLSSEQVPNEPITSTNGSSYYCYVADTSTHEHWTRRWSSTLWELDGNYPSAEQVEDVLEDLKTACLVVELRSGVLRYAHDFIKQLAEKLQKQQEHVKACSRDQLLPRHQPSDGTLEAAYLYCNTQGFTLGPATMCLRMLDLRCSYIMFDVFASHSLKMHSLAGLRYLTLARSDLVTVPDSVAGLASLEVLDLHACLKLVSLSGKVAALPRLRRIDLRSCGSLEQLPLELGRPNNNGDVFHPLARWRFCELHLQPPNADPRQQASQYAPTAEELRGLQPLVTFIGGLLGSPAPALHNKAVRESLCVACQALRDCLAENAAGVQSELQGLPHVLLTAIGHIIQLKPDYGVAAGVLSSLLRTYWHWVCEWAPPSEEFIYVIRKLLDQRHPSFAPQPESWEHCYSIECNAAGLLRVAANCGYGSRMLEAGILTTLSRVLECSRDEHAIEMSAPAVSNIIRDRRSAALSTFWEGCSDDVRQGADDVVKLLHRLLARPGTNGSDSLAVTALMRMADIPCSHLRTQAASALHDLGFCLCQQS